MTKGGDRAGSTRGFALIAVVWFLVLTAAIGSYLLANARSETALARNVRAAADAEALADAGVAQAVFNETDPVLANRWKLDGEAHRITLNKGEIAIRVYDETAKINPNHASDALLTALFQGLGVDRPRARRLGAAIADWVGPEFASRPFGAKLDQYRAAGKSYGPPNAPADTLDELKLVLGMTPPLYTLVRPYLTIYTEGEAPDLTNAGTVIRRAVLLAQRAEAAADDADTDAAPDPQAQNGMMADERVLDLEITAHSADGGVFVRHAVLQIDPSTPKGYAVLDWRRAETVE